jgi:hypothetical protein
MRFSHPIVPARRAKPAMAGQSSAAVFGADRSNHFLVASGAMAAASGIVITSQQHSPVRPKSVSGSPDNKRLCLDLSHVQNAKRRCYRFAIAPEASYPLCVQQQKVNAAFRMPAQNQRQTFRSAVVMSALPPTADSAVQLGMSAKGQSQSVILFTLSLRPKFQVWIQVTWGTNAMNEITLDQNDEELLAYEISDEVLEVAACNEHDCRRRDFERMGRAPMCLPDNHEDQTSYT